MKLSKETQTLVKNFASINMNLLIKQGNKLSTRNEGNNVFAEVTVSETFPQDFGIYDVNEFLGVVSLFESPDFAFNGDIVEVKEGKNVIKYKAAEANILKAPSKSIVFPEDESNITFKLAASDLDHIIRSAGILKVNDLTVVGDGNTVVARVVDVKNVMSNKFEIDLGKSDKKFTAYLKVENLKMLPGAYDVTIAKMKICRFKNTSAELCYYVAVEAGSTAE
jgi:hypothetical protein